MSWEAALYYLAPWNTLHNGDLIFEGKGRLHHREDEIMKSLKELTQ